MTLDADDLTRIKKIIVGVVNESQERLARMIAKEVLGIREELTRMRQEEPALESEVADMKAGYDVLKQRVHSIETGVAEGREAMKTFEGRIRKLEAQVL